MTNGDELANRDAGEGHVHIGFPATCRYIGWYLDLVIKGKDSALQGGAWVREDLYPCSRR
jgi:hypothetical protein